MRKLLILAVALMLIASAAPVWACAALIGTRGSVQLGRTTTLAAYFHGKEHYITSFEFSGGGGEFGSIVPLPGIPEKVEKAGEWTLQRLIQETQTRFTGGVARAASSGSGGSAQVIQEVRIDALDITILKGGGDEVGIWAKDHGFLLPPDAPEVLDFYSKRSPIFMAAIFDSKAASERGQEFGDGTPIHLTIPATNPWVPLRILGLGNTGSSLVQADVYLLTERRPALLPVRAEGIELRLRQPASESLLADLRSEKSMEWLPASGVWLTYMSINAQASKLKFDLATDVSGRGKPSYRLAGLAEPLRPSPSPTPSAQAQVASESPQPAPSATSPESKTLSVVDTQPRSGWAWWALGLLLLVTTISISVALRARRT